MIFTPQINLKRLTL